MAWQKNKNVVRGVTFYICIFFTFNWVKNCSIFFTQLFVLLFQSQMYFCHLCRYESLHQLPQRTEPNQWSDPLTDFFSALTMRRGFEWCPGCTDASKKKLIVQLPIIKSSLSSFINHENLHRFLLTLTICG